MRIPLQGGKTLAHRLVKASQSPSFLSGKKTGLHCSHKLIGLRFKAPNVDFVVVISKDLAHPWIGGHNFLRWLTSSKNKNLVEPFRRKTKYASVLFMLQILAPSLHLVCLLLLPPRPALLIPATIGVAGDIDERVPGKACQLIGHSLSVGQLCGVKHSCHVVTSFHVW